MIKDAQGEVVIDGDEEARSLAEMIFGTRHLGRLREKYAELQGRLNTLRLLIAEIETHKRQAR